MRQLQGRNLYSDMLVSKDLTIYRMEAQLGLGVGSRYVRFSTYYTCGRWLIILTSPSSYLFSSPLMSSSNSQLQSPFAKLDLVFSYPQSFSSGVLWWLYVPASLPVNLTNKDSASHSFNPGKPSFPFEWSSVPSRQAASPVNTISFLHGTLDVRIRFSNLHVPHWHPPDDLFKRTSVFYLIGVFGSAISGVLALGFSKMDGLGNYAGWRWIFIMEGIITCLIGLAGYVFMVDFPEQAHKAWGFLTERESAYITRRINRDRQDAGLDKFSFSKFIKPARDLKVWGFALIFL